MTVILFGATGLVGSVLCERLVRQGATVIAPVRRVPARATAGAKYKMVDFSALGPVFDDAETLYYCLGTTRRDAGSSAKFREIELSLAHSVLKGAKVAGVKRVVLLSSRGADPNAKVNYLKVKGEIEQLSRTLGFAHTVVLRPSLLIGERERKRPLEEVFQKASRPLLGKLQKMMPAMAPVTAEQVAAAMIRAGAEQGSRFEVWENMRIIAEADHHKKC